MSIKEASIKWSISERSVRNYCALSRVKGASLDGGVWKIPSDAKKPVRRNKKENKNYLLQRLREEKKHAIKGGIYHKLQIDMTYNSNQKTRLIISARSVT